MKVLHFDQRLGAVHSKCWLKYKLFSDFLHEKHKIVKNIKEEMQENEAK